MASRHFPALILALCSAALLTPLSAKAETLLTHATLRKVQNRVELTKNKQVLRARSADVMVPGNLLRTYQQAMAELRFNDQSVARVGERAVFRFQPNTRSFDLKSGTVLLLIQPGQGTTRVKTPNAAAGIRGSALFLRYLVDTEVTMIGALTNSDIEISADNGTKAILKAGELGVIYKGQISIYKFDQKRFQQTSPFFQDIDWNEAPIAVKAEIEAALSGQPQFASAYQETPAWTQLAENRLPPSPSLKDKENLLLKNGPSESVASVINRLREDLMPEMRERPTFVPTFSRPPVGPAITPGPSGGPVNPEPGGRQEPTVPVGGGGGGPIARPEPPTVPPTQVTLPSPVTPPQAEVPPVNQLPAANNPPTRPAPAPPPTPVVTAPASPVVNSTPAVVTPPVTTVVTPPAAAAAPPPQPQVPATVLPLDPPAVQPTPAIEPPPAATPGAGVVSVEAEVTRPIPAVP